MGLSSSQARLLNLTSRMHQIEYKAARLEAEKLQMANESDRVYDEYLEALDKTKIQHKQLTTDGAITYVDFQSYSDFTNAGFALVLNNRTYDSTTLGAVYSAIYGWCDADYASRPLTNFDPGSSSAQDKELAARFHITTAFTGTKYLTEKLNGEQIISNIAMLWGSPQALDWNVLKAVLGIDQENDFETTLTNIIQSGEVTIVTKDDQGNWLQPSDPSFHLFETSVSTNTNLREEKDEVLLKKAEAKYEADMKKIDRKERKYDADLASFDNERNAIKQEMDTLKTVAKDNVERTFKLFS